MVREATLDDRVLLVAAEGFSGRDRALEMRRSIGIGPREGGARDCRSGSAVALPPSGTRRGCFWPRADIAGPRLVLLLRPEAAATEALPNRVGAVQVGDLGTQFVGELLPEVP